MINKTKKQIAICVIFAVILSVLGVTPIFAAEDKTASMKLETASNEIYRGQVLRVNLALDFENSLIENGGIMVFRCGLKFDPEILEIIDPNTLQPVLFDDSGKVLEGSMYKFGDIGTEGSFSAVYNTDEKTIILFYGGQSDETFIYTPGAVVQFAFRAHTDLEINNSVLTKIELVIPEISVADITIDDEGNASFGSPIAAEVTGDTANFTLLPPFDLSSVSSQKQNSTFYLSGRSIIGTDSDLPLTAAIINSDGDILAEQEAAMTKTKYNFEFALDENIYPAGRYTVKLTYDNTSATALFDILEEEAPYTPPVQPDEPNEGEGDNTNEDSSGDNTGSESNTGTNTGSGTNTGTNSGSSSSNGSSTKPGAATNNDTGSADTYKPTVKYPSDIASHWAVDNVKYVYDNSLMNGYEDGTFGPDNSITRAEFVTVMARLIGLAEAPESAARFADASSHWAKGYIGALAANGIVGGISDTEFAPDENITREQIAAILSRAFDLAEAETSAKYADDAQISSWAYDSVYKVFSAGYMQGDTNNNFNPLASATRAEVATIIYRLHSALHTAM